MQFTLPTLLALALSTSVTAAAVEKRLDAVPLSIFTGTGCNSTPTPLTTAYVPTDGSCFGIAPILSGNTDSGLIDQVLLKTLPKGCSLLVYSDYTCSSSNFITYDVTGRCGTFGPGVLIHSAKTVGTCA